MNLDTRCKNVDINNNDDDDKDSKINDDFEEDENNTDEEDDEPDFMDNSGKCWEFASKIGNEKHLKKWCQNKMGGMIVGKEEKLTRQFHCPIKECQFKTIFLKSCSIVYKRNKHNHPVKNAINSRKKEVKVKPPSQSAIERNYVDHQGKLWHFHSHIGKNVSQDKLLTKFGFSEFKKNQTTLNLRCRHRNLSGGFCSFVGIYLKSNGCLYTRGEHEHTKRKKMPQNIGDDYVDHLGRIWKFNKEIGKNVKREIFNNKFGFNYINTYVSGFNLHCGKKAPNGRCKYAGIYFNSNGCLYTRGEHEHAFPEKNPKPNVGDDYVDHLGKTWPFHSKIGKQPIRNEIWRNKFGFLEIQQMQRTLNLYCKKKTNGKKCPFAGIYVKKNGCLYIRGKHEHK